MNVQGVNNNKIGFGMALHMEDVKTVKRVLGNKVALDFNEAKPVLEDMAKDVDIIVRPSRYVHSPVLPVDYISVTAQQKDVTLKDKVKRLFGRRPIYKQEEFIPASMSSAKYIIENAEKAKKTLLDAIG